jgi:putative transcriptional regulator
MLRPEKGSIIRGTGVIRKLRWSGKGHGKSGGLRKLTQSIRQTGKIQRGTMKASRVRIVEPEDIRSIRQELKKTQSEFALMIGVSVATLRNWEQG